MSDSQLPKPRQKRPHLSDHLSDFIEELDTSGPDLSTPKATFRTWLKGARLRTLPMAVASVIAGTAAAATVDDTVHWWLALACAVVAISLQIGVNFCNDYSDGIRGTDAHRAEASGDAPMRLTASGVVHAKHVLMAGLGSFAVAAIVGLIVVIYTQHWWFIAVGIVCILAAWYYTGGRRPYGYRALGEFFVFIFFGIVATIGTTFVEVGQVPGEAWLAAVGVGCFAISVLLANNLRDLELDRLVGKRTLSTFIGKRGSQLLFTIIVLVPFAIIVLIALNWPVAWLGLLVLALVVPTIVTVWRFRQPRELIPALALLSLSDLAWAVVLFIAWAL